MKRLIPIPLLALIVVGIISCKKSHPSPTPVPVKRSSFFMGYFCNPSLSNVLNIKENGQFVEGIGPGDINYTNVTELSDTLYLQFSLSGAGSASDTTFASFNEILTTGNHYSIFFGGQASNPCKIFMVDNFPTVDSGKVAVRFVDMSSDSARFDCYLDSTKLYTGLGYTQFSPFYQLSISSTSTLYFHLTGTTSGGALIDSLHMQAGFIYSIVLCGNSTYKVQEVSQVLPLVAL